ncbi:hypothetical protein GGH12_001795 [Coemansia sp. RSA 1822]|nr:hypothetical protein LPJ76_005925 [Coemansia sp. RSA 638]KAJ2118870.1 hypothetical protein IW147_006267 [Coemansia sp. RSA 720]KAJ2564827.1 hypothetical protein GGH12_001795 [Coemansia sp. RSA 1822]
MDSDVEEVANVQVRPRVVRRPVPVRSQVSATYESVDSESDDDDFFRLHQQTSAALESDSNSTPPSPDVAASEEESHVVDLDSDSDVDSTSDIEKNAVVGEKRKHAGEDAPNTRSRSVSLTPPPSAPHHEPAPNVPAPAPFIHTFELDSDTDTRDLDPSLQAVIQSTPIAHARSQPQENSPAPRTPRPALERVQIEFQFMYDPEFLAHELPLLWDPRRWGRIRSPATIEKKLQEHVAVVVFTTDVVATAVAAYSDIFVVDVLATDPVLMDRMTRVFPTSTLASLGDKLAVYIKVFPRSVYNRRREREAVEMARVEGEREQARRDLEMVQELRQAGDTLPSENLNLGHEDNSSNNISGIRIKIRDKAGRDTLLLVTAATKVQSVVENYCKLAQLQPGTKVRLEFDDEALDPSDTIGNTEIEDDDMLTAFCI